MTAFDEDTQAVVLEVAKTVCSASDKLHLAVKAFCYPIVARETPHADDGRNYDLKDLSPEGLRTPSIF